MQQHTPYDDGVPPRITAVSAKPLASKRTDRRGDALARELDAMIARGDRIAARAERERAMAGKAARGRRNCSR